MSSKLRRGGCIPTERPSWQRVNSYDAVGAPSLNQNPEGVGPAGSPEATPSHGDVRRIHQQGYDEGQAAARHAYAAQLEAMQMKLARTIEEITGLRQRYRQEAERDVVALAFAISRRILHRELTIDPDALLGLVKAALAKMDAQEVNRARVSSEDAPLVQAFFQKTGIPHRIEVIADARLASGSVILESDRGALDASVDTQLNEIERGFADLVRRAS